MKRIFNLLALGALPLLWSCSPEAPEAPKVPVDAKGNAYMAINMQATGSTVTRAADNPDYAYGSAQEHEVKNAVFVFYDAQGNFVCTGTLDNTVANWAPGQSDDKNPGYTPSENESGNNVEYFGKNIVILKGLEEDEVPAQVLTILNLPAGMTEKSIRDAALSADKQMDELVKSVTTTIGDADYFTMTTSVYLDNTNKVYNLTPVSTDKLYGSVQEAQDAANVLAIYVERLAAKVQVSIAATAASNGLFRLDGITMVTKQGDQYKEASNFKAYARIDGWDLNATSRTSYLSKQITPDWTSGANQNARLGDWWNRPADSRCFWAMGTTYGKTLLSDYLYLGADGTMTPYPETNLTYSYKNWNQLGNTVGSASYCAENTNKVHDTWHVITNDKDTRVIPKNVTHVLLKATLFVSDQGDGKVNTQTPATLYRYNGHLFYGGQNGASFIDYLVGELATGGYMNVYTKDAAGKYTQLGNSSFKLELTGTGTGVVTLHANIPDGTALYEKNDDGTFAAIDLKGATPSAWVNEEIQPGMGTAMAYTDGCMYYAIPIRHIAPVADVPAGQAVPVVEGNYGVVRNHLYDITVNNIKNLGMGVFYPGTGIGENPNDPGEPIIPEDPDPDYFLSAVIKVLTWRVVKQGVDL